MVVKKHRKIKSRISVVLFFSVMSVFFSGLFFCGCASDEKRQEKNNESAIQSDSLIVEQLIYRSITLYRESSLKVPVDVFLEEALDMAELHNLISLQAKIYNIIGVRKRGQSDFEGAMKAHREALTLAQMINEEKILTDIYNQFGVVYRRIDNNNLALDMHFTALQLAQKNNDSLNVSISINSIGNVNLSLERFHTAIEYFTKSLDFSKEQNNIRGQAINNNNIGSCWLGLGYPDSALVYQTKSLEFNLLEGNIDGQAICYNSIGSSYIAKKEPYKALEYIEKSIALSRKSGNLIEISASLSKRGEIYLELKQYDAAIKNFEESLRLALEIGSKFHAERASQFISTIYETKGNHQDALKYFKMASNYKDSIINEKNMHHLIALETAHDVDNQRKKIQELNQEAVLQQTMLNRQQFMLIVTLVAAGAIIFVILLLIFQYRLRAKFDNLKYQQRLFRTQMNPHFIFNALSAIQLYVLENETEKSIRFLTDFSKLMRHVLQSSNSDYISVKEETEILSYYLSLQKQRFVPPFNFSIEIDDAISVENTIVPPMLAQPFVENAVEHGIRNLGHEGFIKILFKKSEKQLIIEVDDNGIGINSSLEKADENKNHESMAIKITRRRLDVIRRDSKGKTGLEIIDKKVLNPFDRGTKARLILPLIEFNSTKSKT